MELEQGKLNEKFYVSGTEISADSPRNRIELDQENSKEIFCAYGTDIFLGSSRNKNELDEEELAEEFDASDPEILVDWPRNKMELDQENMKEILGSYGTEIFLNSSRNRNELDEEELAEEFDASDPEILVDWPRTKMELDQENLKEILGSYGTEKFLDSRSRKELDEEMLNEKFDASGTEILPDSSRNRRCRVKGKKKINQRSVDIKSFKTSILRTKKVLLSKMQLEKRTLDEMDDLMFHLLENFDKELHAIKRKEFGFRKTVSLRDLETVVRLCLPKGLGAPVTEFANMAVETYFKQVLKED